MSAFRHPHNVAVRPIEEELAEMGLDPDRVLSEIDRNTAMLEEGAALFNLSGLQEGDSSPRSMAQYNSTLLAKKEGLEEGEDLEDESYLGESGYSSKVIGKKKFPFIKGKEKAYPVSEVRYDGKVIGKVIMSPHPKGATYGEGYIAVDTEGNELPWSQNKNAQYRKLLSKSGFKEDLEDLEEAKSLKIGSDSYQVVKNYPSKGDADGPFPKSFIRMIKKGGGAALLKSGSDYYFLATMPGGKPDGSPVWLKPAQSKRVMSYEHLDADIQYLIDEGWELGEDWEIEDELDEAALGVVKKAKGAAARIAKRLRHREYLKSRGARKLDAKIYRQKFKRKIKRTNVKKLRKFGAKGLEKLHKMDRRVVQKSWSDEIATIYEELGQSTAPITEDHDDITEDEDIEISPAVEALLNAAKTALYLGEIFHAMGEDTGEILFQLSDKAVDLSDAVEENEDGEPSDEQEEHIQTVLKSVIKALTEYEECGSPSLSEAIGISMVLEGVGEWDELVEYVPPSPAKMGFFSVPSPSSMGFTPDPIEPDDEPMVAPRRKLRRQGSGGERPLVVHRGGGGVPAGKTVAPDTSVAGKYLKAINMAMQDKNITNAMNAAKAVISKHKAIDGRGRHIKRIDTMTDVLRVIFYLSQITGLKAPAWMYKGKRKPWFVHPDDAEPGDVNFDPERKQKIAKAELEKYARDDKDLKAATAALMPGFGHMFGGAKAS